MEDNKKTGIKVGATTAGFGGLTLLGRKILKDNYEGKGPTRLKKYAPEKVKEAIVNSAKKVGTTPEALIKSGKGIGIASIGAGSALVGVSAYKHYKNKKKKKDDSTEK